MLLTLLFFVILFVAVCFYDCAEQNFSVIGKIFSFIIGFLSLAAAATCIVTIIDNHGEKKDAIIEQNQATYEYIVSRIDALNDEDPENFTLAELELYGETAQWNDTISVYMTLAKSPWTNWFCPSEVTEQLEDMYIEYPGMSM